MNWTEGGLARHSRASKGRVVLLRQKEHFAKARSGLLNSNVKTSPPSIFFLAQPTASFSPACRQSTSSNHTSGAALSSKKRAKDKDVPRNSHYLQCDSGANLPTLADFQKDVGEEEALRQKKRKLLLRGDWTGTILQKPIEIEFSKARGSHEGPWSLSKTRHLNSSKDRQRRMLGIKHPLQAGIRSARPFSPRQLRVRVGSREMTLGGSCNVTPRSRACRDVESSPQEAPISKSSHHEKRRRRTNLDDPSTPITTRGLEFPELHQPMPHRPFLPSLLHSFSSDPDDTASIKARVGVLLPDVPPSQVEQNEAWWNFVGGDEHVQVDSEQHPSVDQHAIQRVISPGISQLGLPSGFDKGDVGLTLVQGSPYTSDESSVAHRSPEQEIPLQCHQRHVVVREVTALEDDIAREPAYSSLGSSPPTPKEASRAGEEMLPEKEYRPYCMDAVSRVPQPTSSSPSPEESPAQLYDRNNSSDANFQDAEFQNDNRSSCQPKTWGEASQVAYPTSSSPTSENFLAQFHNFIGIQYVEAPDANMYSDVERGDNEVVIQNQHIEEGDIKHGCAGHGIAHQDLPSAGPLHPAQQKVNTVTTEWYENRQSTKHKSCNTEENESDIWRNFVFGDTDDNFEEAFLEASIETAKNLCPSLASTCASTGDDEMNTDTRLCHGFSRKAATFSRPSVTDESRFAGDQCSSSHGGTVTTALSDEANTGSSSPDPLAKLSSPELATQHDLCGTDNSVVDATSNKATSGGSSPSLLSELNLEHLMTANQTVAGSFILFKSAPLSVENDFLSRSDAWSLVTGGNDNTSLVAQPPSTYQDSEADSFKFARPKPFTGKRIQIDEQRQIALSAAQIRGKGVSWRRGKRTGDGRAKIRNLPSFDDDPIEEVEWEEKLSSAKNALKPSFFGSLDTEDDFEE